MERTRYIVLYTDYVRKKLPSLPKSVLSVIKKAIEERLTVAPLELGKPLGGSLRGYYRLRVGHYRIIYCVEKKTVTVLIVEIDHRSIVYQCPVSKE
ncbi:MAG: type II toxin-antitoxin system RelE/ParE family toxin [Chlamydiales bacterium]|nr:type II toxin-antitoxin system RelE/ParE family toxin [Chlamydiales bacterium]